MITWPSLLCCHDLWLPLATFGYLSLAIHIYYRRGSDQIIRLEHFAQVGTIANVCVLVVAVVAPFGGHNPSGGKMRHSRP